MHYHKQSSAKENHPSKSLLLPILLWREDVQTFFRFKILRRGNIWLLRNTTGNRQGNRKGQFLWIVRIYDKFLGSFSAIVICYWQIFVVQSKWLSIFSDAFVKSVILFSHFDKANLRADIKYRLTFEKNHIPRLSA